MTNVTCREGYVWVRNVFLRGVDSRKSKWNRSIASYTIVVEDVDSEAEDDGISINPLVDALFDEVDSLRMQVSFIIQ